MSYDLLPAPIRIFGDRSNPIVTSILDLADNGNAASLVRGDDWQFDIGLGDLGNLLTGLVVTGAGGIASFTLQLFQRQNDPNPPQWAFNSAVAGFGLNTALTQVEWNAGGSANAHFNFVVPNTYTAISLGGAVKGTFWLRGFATTSDSPTAKQITFIEGQITINDGPISAVSSVAPAYFRLFTVNGNIVPQLYDPITQHYYNLEIDTVGGVRTLSLGDIAY